MAKGKIKDGDELALRVAVRKVWPDGSITVFIKSASAGGTVTLIDDRDLEDPGKRDRLV